MSRLKDIADVQGEKIKDQDNELKNQGEEIKVLDKQVKNQAGEFTNKLSQLEQKFENLVSLRRPGPRFFSHPNHEEKSEHPLPAARRRQGGL